MRNKREINKKINNLRGQMEELIDKKGTKDPKVMNISKEIDGLINEYYNNFKKENDRNDMDKSQIIIIKGDLKCDNLCDLSIEQIRAIAKLEGKEILVDTNLDISPGKHNKRISLSDDLLHIGVHGYTTALLLRKPLEIVSNSDKNDKIRKLIVKLLMEKGANVSSKGFAYLFDAVIILTKSYKSLTPLTTSKIYEIIAKEKGVTSQNIKKSVQRAAKGVTPTELIKEVSNAIYPLA